MRQNRLRKRSLQTSRPSIPVPCILVVCCIVGVFLSAVIVDLVDRDFITTLLIIGSFAVSGLLIVVLFKRSGLALWCVVFLVIGTMLGLLQHSSLDQARAKASVQFEVYSFTLAEDSKESTYGSQAVATIDNGALAGQKVLLFMKEKVDFLAGDHLQVETRLVAPKDEYLAYYNKRGIALSAEVNEYVFSENETLLSPLYQLRKRMLNVLGSGSDEQTLLRAVMLGERRALFDAGFYQDIKIAGLAHLVAVSGAHLVIVTGFVTVLLKALRVSSKVSVALQTLFLVAYLILVGFPVSCIRAALMSTITLFALIAKRRSSSLTALGIAVLFMVVFDPSVVYQLSFQLSVTSTLGIVMFMPLLNEWFASLVPKVPEFIRESISMTLTALMLSLPISAAQFASLPLISPIANIVAIPYLSLLLMFGFLSLLFCSVFPGLLVILDLLASILISFFSAIGSIPFASIPVSTTIGFSFPLSLGIAVLLWLWWPTPRHKRRQILIAFGSTLLICLVLVTGLKMMPVGDKIVMLNVGQGDSFAFMSNGKTLLVDTGNEQEMLYSSLARNNITRIDAVLITHPDDDHCGNLDALTGVVDVRQVVIAEGLDEVADDKVEEFMKGLSHVVGRDRIIKVKRGDTIRFGVFTLEIVSPLQIENKGGNEDSICFYARIDCDQDGVIDWNAFFCGDAEAEVLEELENDHLLESVDIYKVGHHGSRKAITPDLAATLSPKISFIGVGKNSYGHPTEETLASLEAAGSKIYRSDLCGDVVCSFSTNSLELSTERSVG